MGRVVELLKKFKYKKTGAILVGKAANANAAASGLLTSEPVLTPVESVSVESVSDICLDEDDIGTNNSVGILIAEGANYPQVPADAGCNPGHQGEDSNDFDLSSRAAAGTKMTFTLIDKTLFFASCAELYAVRGLQLKEMSLYLWSKLITVIKKPIEDLDQVQQMHVKLDLLLRYGQNYGTVILTSS